MDEERTAIMERIDKLLSAVDIKLLRAIERIIGTYVNAANRARG